MDASALKLASLEALLVALVACAWGTPAIAGSASAAFTVRGSFAAGGGSCRLDPASGLIVCTPSAPGGGGGVPNPPAPGGGSANPPAPGGGTTEPPFPTSGGGSTPPPPPGSIGTPGPAPAPVAGSPSYFWRWRPQALTQEGEGFVWLIDPDGPAGFNLTLGASSSTRIVRIGERQFLEMTVSW